MEKLPNEVVLQIFKKLDNMESMLVCKKWHELILWSNVMDFNIQLSKDPERKYKRVLKSERSFSSFRFNFYSCVNEPPNLRELQQKVALKIGSQIKNLEAIRSYIQLDQWITLIKKTSNLEHLKIIATRLVYPEDQNDPFQQPTEQIILKDEDVPELPMLKSVFLKNCSELFCKFLSKSRNIQEINVTLARESVVQELLMSQPGLRKIHNIIPFNQNIFRRVCELKFLVELDLDLDKTDFLDFDQMRGVFNVSLQKLTLTGETEINNLIIILSVFPNLIELSINNHNLLSQELMDYINQNHQKLESIRLNSCSKDIFQYIRLQNLKLLEISENQKIESWLKFIENNPSIESLVVKDELLTNEHFYLFTSKIKNLKSLDLRHELLTREILEIALNKEKCKLKILRLKNIFGKKGFELQDEDLQRLRESNGLLLFIK